MSVILDVELGLLAGSDGIGGLRGGIHSVSRCTVLLTGKNHGSLTCKYNFRGGYLVVVVVAVWGVVVIWAEVVGQPTGELVQQSHFSSDS